MRSTKALEKKSTRKPKQTGETKTRKQNTPEKRETKTLGTKTRENKKHQEQQKHEKTNTLDKNTR